MKMTAYIASLKVSIEYIDSSKGRKIIQKQSRDRYRTTSGDAFGRYVSDMLDRTWVDCVSMLAFDLDGNLIDGGHRVRSVIESGIGQWFVVIRGLNKEAIRHFDQGLNRTVPQELSFRGETNVSILSPALSFCNMYKDHKDYSRKRKVSKNHLMTLLDDTPRLRDLCLLQSYRRYDCKCIRDGLGAALSYEMEQAAGMDSMVDFFYKLDHPEMISYMHPINHLNRRLSRAYRATRSADKMDAYQKAGLTAKTWNYFIAGTTDLKRLKWDTREGFPGFENGIVE